MLEVLPNELCIEPQDPIAKPSELAIGALIRDAALLVIAAIDFHPAAEQLVAR